jgi:hypothetical protein
LDWIHVFFGSIWSQTNIESVNIFAIRISSKKQFSDSLAKQLPKSIFLTENVVMVDLKKTFHCSAFNEQLQNCSINILGRFKAAFDLQRWLQHIFPILSLTKCERNIFPKIVLQKYLSRNVFPSLIFFALYHSVV